ncbi:LPS-assembly protein LptD [Wenxinia saemankumensis]|uniref:LPS-assembly protein LptD n=1 Tax=Wenxinia saemankumensis TaxID=1447782 RepID=A0A1M6HHN1_9RHOB|nr:LPS assembly protein LptD [Wenxinia saemankumensis]SHJ21599.1 LPS-assembly protein [Wenxinia saemankumensis]
MIRLALLLICLAWLGPGRAAAQGTASLVADRVSVDEGGRLVASGGVEVFYDGTRLTADSVTYSRDGDRLAIEGPILIEQPDGTILTAEAASLDPRIESGILRSARLVLERQLQLAAARIDRIDGRYTALTGAAATACQVCAGRAPLWEIRADRVIHDEVDRQLYFENAQFRIRGLPVLWVPAMRLPDPTVTRATGLLVPSVTTNDLLGFGVRLPYFVALGPRRDLTLTPFLATETTTVEGRYRQTWRSGALTVEGAASRDSVRPGGPRGYVFADGRWALEDGQSILFQLQSVTDRTYLDEYGYSDLDRLSTGLRYTRVREDSLLSTDATYYRTLRRGEVQGALPPLVARAVYERRRPTGPLVLTYGARAESFRRTEDAAGPTGRDVARLGAFADLRGETVLGPGLVLSGAGSVDLGAYAISDDPAFEDLPLRATPGALVTLRWPLIRREAGGAAQTLEPFVAAAWSRTLGADVPNEDSAIVEFDETNIDALTRYPGQDAREDGARLSFGLTWTRTAPSGSALALTFGRILREEAEPFTLSSGLDGLASDWLLAARADLPAGLTARARAIVDNEGQFDKTEARIDWQTSSLALGATYLFLPQEPPEGRLDRIAEWAVDARWQVSPVWSLSLDARYDLARDEPVETGIGLGWQSECVEVDVSLSRSYTSGETDPVTDLGLAVNLRGFSAGDGLAVPPGRCDG